MSRRARRVGTGACGDAVERFAHVGALVGGIGLLDEADFQDFTHYIKVAVKFGLCLAGGFDHTRRILHSNTMQRTMLRDERPAIDSDDFAVGENLLKNADRGCVLRHAISGHQHSAIDNQEVGIGGWQAMSIGGMNRFRPGKRDELVGMAVEGSEFAQFRFHFREFFVVFIGRVVAFDVSDGIF